MLHLLHPAIVHFSVAFLVFGALCEAGGLLSGRETAARFGGRLVLLGLASLTLTLFTGYVAANTVELTPEAERLLAAHERNGWFVCGAFVALVFWKGWYQGELPRQHHGLYAALLLGAAALTGYSALLGGEMVYVHGVGVR